MKEISLKDVKVGDPVALVKNNIVSQYKVYDCDQNTIIIGSTIETATFCKTTGKVLKSRHNEKEWYIRPWTEDDRYIENLQSETNGNLHQLRYRLETNHCRDSVVLCEINKLLQQAKNLYDKI